MEIITTFKDVKIGQYFTCPYHRRMYIKISEFFAKDMLNNEIIQFVGDEKVYKEWSK